MLLFNLVYLVDVAPLTFPELKNNLIGAKVWNGETLYTEVIDFTAPVTGWVFGVVHWLFGSSLLAQHIFAFVLLFVLAVMIGVIFIDKKAFPDSSFIPSLVFAALCLFSFDVVSLSGTLLGSFFLLLALNSLFREIEFREENFETILKVGVFTGVSSLFEFSFSVYLVAILIIMVIYTRTSGRKIFLVVVGYFLPHLLLVGMYAIKRGVAELWSFFYRPNLLYGFDAFINQKDLLALLAVPLLFFIAALVILNRESRFTKYQSQVLQAMFFWTIFGFVQVYYSRTMRPHSFLPVMIGLSFFISHFFLIIVRKRFAELSFWLFVAGILGTSLFFRYGSGSESAYRKLYVTHVTQEPVAGKRIVVLADSLSLYHGNIMATPFLEWELAEPIFRQPEYYDNIARVSEGFKREPEIIIDPENLMKPFMDRIPDLRRKYKKVDGGYELQQRR